MAIQFVISPKVWLLPRELCWFPFILDNLFCKRQWVLQGSKTGQTGSVTAPNPDTGGEKQQPPTMLTMEMLS